MPDWRRRLSSLSEMVVGSHHGGAPAVGTFTTTLATNHHGQQGVGWSSKINIMGRRFLSQLAKDRKGKVGGLTHRYLHHEGDPKRQLRTHVGIMCGMPGASSFIPSDSCNAPLTTNKGRACIPTTLIHPTWWGIMEGVSHPWLLKEHGASIPSMKKSQQASGMTQLYTNDINQIRNYHS
jgi:hypothetical protein